MTASVDLSGSTNGAVAGNPPAVNHFQNQMMTMLYPSIMAELGLSYTAVGALAAVCSMLNSLCQDGTTKEQPDGAFPLRD